MSIERKNEIEAFAKEYGLSFASAKRMLEEIEAEYELLVPQKELNNYCGWEEIFRLIKKSE